jgi:hypothetical protein
LLNNLKGKALVKVISKLSFSSLKILKFSQVQVHSSLVPKDVYDDVIAILDDEFKFKMPKIFMFKNVKNTLIT